jgi:IS5 family transposase
MGPKTPVPVGDFFRQPLRERSNLKHPLVQLADPIDWQRSNAAMSASLVSHRGRQRRRG